MLTSNGACSSRRARNSATDRRELVDDGLILAPLLERLSGKRVVAQRALAVLRDDAARRRFGRREVAEPRAAPATADTARARRSRRAATTSVRSVARLGREFSRPPAFNSAEAYRDFRSALRGCAAAARARTRQPPPSIAARARRNPASVGSSSRIVGRALFEPRDRVAHRAPRRRTPRASSVGPSLPAGLLAHEIGEQRDRLVERACREVEPRERRADVRIGFGRLSIDRQLEVLNRLREVFAVRAGVLRGVAAAVRFRRASRRRCRARGAPRGWPARPSAPVRPRRSPRRVGSAACTGRPARPRNVRRARIELDRAFERRDRAVDVVRRLRGDGRRGTRRRPRRLRRDPRRASALRAVTPAPRRHGTKRPPRARQSFIRWNCSTKERRCHIFAACPSTRNCSKFWRVPTAKRRSRSSRTAPRSSARTCKRVYPIKDDIPVMLIDEATIEPESGNRVIW